jgi:hypothetical protein
MIKTLWRLDGPSAATLNEPARLAEALRVHLAHHDLVAVLVQIGERQQLYLSLTGCAGCTLGRCEPGCPRDLLGRALSRCFPVCRMWPVPGGLATRAYQRPVLALPGAEAQPLTGSLLHAWPEARLVVHWRAGRQQLQVGAQLAISVASPEPHAQLAALGWRTQQSLLPQRATPPIPAGVPVLGSWPDAPYLPLPASRATPLSAHQGAALPEQSPPDGELERLLAARLCEHLAPLIVVDEEADARAFRQETATHSAVKAVNADHELSDPIETEVAVLEPEEISIWPAGPGRMRPADVAFLIEQIRSSPIVQTGDEPGVTRRRIAQLLPEDLAEYSRQLIYWLDQAGALVAPAVPTEPFRNPRCLHDASDEVLAAQLAATPIPPPELARAAMQR